MPMNYLSQAQQLQEKMTAWRRWLHSHAQTGFNLNETATYVKNELEKMGLAVHECGKCGLVAQITGAPGKTILLRADMDALPIREETGLPYACENGNMHACGHDLHTAMLMGAAQVLMHNKSSLRGTVRLMFQSAEEVFEGAADMIRNGVLQGVDAAAMIHVCAGLPLPCGTIIVSKPGVSAPAADYFTVTVNGKSCHGSTPHNGVDALSAAAHILVGLQELHARELPPDSAAVLTIGKFHGGTAGNVIADFAQMEGTIRTYDEKLRSFLKERMRNISDAIASAYRAKAGITFASGCPTLKNDPQLCESFYRYLNQSDGIQVLDAASFGECKGGGSEDFAYISQRVPAVMLALAAGEPEKGYVYPQHHPKVVFDESVLSTGAGALTRIAVQFLAES